jgi:signal transduction histidine kinase
LLGALAVAVLLRASHQAQLLQGTTLTTVAALGILVLLVVVTGFVWATRVARSAASSTVVEYVRVPAPAPAPSVAPMAAQSATVQAVAVPAAADRGVFVHLSHRLQSLVHRQIQMLDELENEVEEPDLLKGLFSVDHLATRMRRHAENLAVLGGAVPRRQWTKPVSVMEILRSAVSETLDYARVQVIARAPGSLNGYAVADVIHLLAELVENATSFSPPDTKVVLRTQAVAAGLVIEVDDRGLGMPQEDYDRLNALLREPAQISVQELLEGARIGLYVVAQLARRHNIAVQLQTNITGGTQALVVLPKALLATEQREHERPTQENPAAMPAAAPQPAQAPLPVRVSARASESGESRHPIETPSPAGRMADLGDAQPIARPLYGTDGAIPPPRREASRPAVGAPAERNWSAPLEPGVPDPAAGPANHQPSAHVSAPASGPPRFTPPSPAPAPPPDPRPRRPLPKRRPQEHLAGPLAQPSPDPADRVGDGLTPNLMADFRRGLVLGAAEPGSGEHPHEQAPTQEGER